MQLSIIIVILGLVAVVNSSDPSQSSKNGKSNKSKDEVRNFKQCKYIETTTSEPVDLPSRITTPEDTTTTRLVPLAPSSTSSSKEINRKELINNILHKNERRLVPPISLNPTSTESSIKFSSGEDSKTLPNNGIQRLLHLPTRTVEIFKVKDEEVPSPSTRKLVPSSTLEETSTSSEDSLETRDQLPDDCEPLPEGLGSRLDAKTLKTLVKTQLG